MRCGEMGCGEVYWECLPPHLCNFVSPYPTSPPPKPPHSMPPHLDPSHPTDYIKTPAPPYLTPLLAAPCSLSPGDRTLSPHKSQLHKITPIIILIFIIINIKIIINNMIMIRNAPIDVSIDDLDVVMWAGVSPGEVGRGDLRCDGVA